ncbi:PKD domain-containing protein [Vibrio gallaecicus]|uniref:PKD domain-containing protein n=1 Tax=Vibrio gallaecicus TaxID=552386 RepID=UPI0010C9E4D1|nr:PKD domain-containing protein [Vibrio gallaecicus]MDN3616923.1 PKD domain-containing protein [Vibrio gallaecicus]
MNSNFKWTLLALSIPTLIACGGGSSSSTPAAVAPSGLAVITAQSVAKVNNRVRVDGLKSEGLDGQSISYQWAISNKPDGSMVSLNSTTAVSPYFTPDMAGNYTLDLITKSGGKDSEKVSYVIDVSDASTNVQPMIDLDIPESVAIGKTVDLHSQAYDVDGDVLTYQWALLSAPNNATMKLTNSATPTANLLSNTAGDYKLKLTVSDGYETISEEVTVSYSAENVAPKARVKNKQTFELGTSALLDATASTDGNDDTITYEWKVVSQPENSTATLSNSTDAQPNFTPDLIGDYVLSLAVSDGEFTSKDEYIRLSATEVGTSNLILKYAEETTARAWPFAEQFNSNISTTGDAPAHILLGTFTLEAVGKDYIINETTAIDYMGNVKAVMTGIEVDQVLNAGDKINVKMWAEPTQGQLSMISYGFIVDTTLEQYMGLGYMYTSTAE